MESKIEQILEKLRPALAQHGGNIRLIAVDNEQKRVVVEFMGACSHCAISEITLRFYIERELKRAVPEIQTVDLQPMT